MTCMFKAQGGWLELYPLCELCIIKSEYMSKQNVKGPMAGQRRQGNAGPMHGDSSCGSTAASSRTCGAHRDSPALRWLDAGLRDNSSRVSLVVAAASGDEVGEQPAARQLAKPKWVTPPFEEPLRLNHCNGKAEIITELASVWAFECVHKRPGRDTDR